MLEYDEGYSPCYAFVRGFCVPDDGDSDLPNPKPAPLASARTRKEVLPTGHRRHLAI